MDAKHKKLVGNNQDRFLQKFQATVGRNVSTVKQILTKQLALKTDNIDTTKNASQINEKILFSSDATL